MSYTDLFYKHIMFRKACGSCHYTNLHRPSDITLADFWHSNDVDPDLHTDNKGMSLVFANAEKGKRLLEMVKSDFSTMKEIDISKAMQRAMREPFPSHPQRDEFEKCYIEKGFEYTYKKFTKMSFKTRVKMKLRKLKNCILQMLR